MMQGTLNIAAFHCMVCDKPLHTGLYNESGSLFCSGVCAAWFGRAVANAVFLSGEDLLRIDNWLLRFTEILRKRTRNKKK